MKILHWEILDEKRKKVLPLLKIVSRDFYLAGGTSLALQLGHRDSVDFDFFTNSEYDIGDLFEKVEQTFVNYKVVKVQFEKHTLSILIDDTIKISFFYHKYKIVLPLVESEYFDLACVEEIACMKFLAITTRSVLKDYLDIYFILKIFSLESILKICSRKYLLLDRNLILKSLVYFNDIELEPIVFKNNMNVEFIVVQDFLRKEVLKLSL